MNAHVIYRADSGRAILSAFQWADAMAFAVTYSAKYRCDVKDENGRIIATRNTSQKEYSIRAIIAWRKRMKMH